MNNFTNRNNRITVAQPCCRVSSGAMHRSRRQSVKREMRYLGLCVLAMLFAVMSRSAHAQNCCGSEAPSEESTTAVGDNATYNTVTDFEMVLDTDDGGYVGSTITEQTGAQGADSCWNSDADPGLVPEYPTVSGGTWTVDSNNSWGYDSVGWSPKSVTYIVANSPIGSDNPIIVDFPCGSQVYQVLSIQYPIVGQSSIIFDDVIQTESIYDGYEENCREGTCGYDDNQ
jgi:hypothetical protein